MKSWTWFVGVIPLSPEHRGVADTEDAQLLLNE